MNASKSCFLFFLCIASLAKALAQPTPPAFNLRVLETPQPTVIDGKPMVYYELLVDNLLNDSLELKTLEVIQTSDHSVVATFNRDDLSRRYSSLDGAHKGRRGVLNPDGSGVIYLELTLKQADAGVHLVHRLEADALNDGPAKKSFSVEGGKIQRSKTSPVVLGMPLRGGPWVAIYEPSWERGHRRVMFATDGEQHIPGRFAIDFIMPDQQGQF